MLSHATPVPPAGPFPQLSIEPLDTHSRKDRQSPERRHHNRKRLKRSVSERTERHLNRFQQGLEEVKVGEEEIEQNFDDRVSVADSNSNHIKPVKLESEVIEEGDARSGCEMLLAASNATRHAQTQRTAQLNLRDTFECSGFKRELSSEPESLNSPAMDRSVSPVTSPTTKDKEISQLVDDIRKLQATVDALKESSALQIAQLETMLSEKTTVIQQLEEKLERQKDYDELKHQLKRLRSFDDEELDVKPHINDELDKDALCEKATSSDDAKRTTPKHLQNVEQFGSILGEEIVSTFSRLLKREECSSPPETPKSAEDAMSSGTEASTGSKSGLSDEIIQQIEKLQDNLRQNMDRYAGESLNTQNIARVVRELLSVHNIGQRLFAKYVLGLSQGTVSELLSKPKPWDKLTEKGRDSYRKMHAWASDENSVNILKSLIPKKAKDGVTSFSQSDSATEERIAQILSDAQQSMITPKKEANGSSPQHDSNNESDSEDVPQNLSHEIPLNSRHNSGNRKYENDDMPQEMVARIYQEELAKLMGQRIEDSFRMQYDRSHDEIRQALSIYHQELSRLSQLALTPGHDFSRFGASLPGALLNGAFGGLSMSPAEIRNRQEALENMRHHGSAFSLVRPGLKFPGGNSNSGGNAPSPPTSTVLALPHETSQATAPQAVQPAAAIPATSPAVNHADDSSPLQRMQSITNSLLSQTTVPSLPVSSPRQAKAVLPPITQQQFDKYNNLNTEDIVKKVKEQLSQYSISQRLFGESVLGLSQGSVSDLLARPKPWHMLTQKGREPFIRMKIFLEDDNAVHKLVASQYKIAPEKLMRTTGFTAAANPMAGIKPPAMIKHHSPELPTGKIPPTMETLAAAMKSGDMNALVALHQQQQHQENATQRAIFNHQSSVSSLRALQQQAQQQVVQQREQEHQRQQDASRHQKQPLPINPLTLNNSSGRPYLQPPSVYEMAALTTDLDTQNITSRIKETLMAHNIGQKIFGEAVLGLSQGSVSELLSKPKPWHMLSIKGREPFIRMQLWLNDPLNVDKLQALKNERREANKRRRSDLDVSRGLDYGFPFASPNSPFPTAAKKPRVLFSDEQKEALRLAFSMDPYPSTATIEFLANELQLSVRTITNWFHNHRMRLKQHVSPNPDDPRPPELNPSMRDSSGANFDPIQFRSMLAQRLRDLQSDKQQTGTNLNNSRNNTPPVFNCYNSYSPSSQTDDGTLDLSMSSNRGQRTPCSEINDDSSADQSDRDTPDDNGSVSTPTPQHNTTHRQALSSTSHRRKPAMPKWVDPGLSPDSENEEESPRDLALNGNKSEMPNDYDRSTDSPSTDSAKRPPFNNNDNEEEDEEDTENGEEDRASTPREHRSKNNGNGWKKH